MKSPSSSKKPLIKHHRPFSSINLRCPQTPLSTLSHRPTTSKPTSPSSMKTQTRDQSTPNLNILKLIIDNDPTQFSNKDIKQRFKSFLHNSDNYFFQSNARPKVKDLFVKYNILYGSNSTNTIKTYLPKMRPVSSSIRGYSKYKLRRKNVFMNSDITNEYDYNKEVNVFNKKDIEMLFKAKCKDLGIQPNDKARLNFVNSLELNMKDRKLDLREFNIGINFIKELERILKAAEGKGSEIAQIKLGKNPLGDNSLKYIMNIVSSSKAITHLDLSSANVSYKKGKIIFTTLKHHNSLISLDLSSKENAYRNRLLSYTMEEAKNMLLKNNYIEYLDLSGNSIRDEGFKLIMEGMIYNTEGHIVSLNLSHNDITNEGMKYFALINRTLPLEQLYLSENPIKSEGLIIICSKTNYLRYLVKLFLDDCNIDFQGFVNVVQTYGHGSHRLDTLVLDNNRLNNKRFEILRELFNSFNVNNLSLRNCDLSELSVSYIGDFLKTNEVMKSINLSSNKIKDTAFVAFSTLPEYTHSLEKIDLSCNLIRDESAIPFVKDLVDNCSIREINLSNNQIQNETAAEVLRTLETNKRLVSVNLSLNFIKSEIIENINMLLKQNKKLSKDKYVPELKASIRTNQIDRSEYDLFKGQIHLSKRQQAKLETNVKEDEIKYENRKRDLHNKLNVLLTQLSHVNKQLQGVDDEIEMNDNIRNEEENKFLLFVNEMNENLKQMNKDINKLELEQIKLNKDVTYNQLDYAEEIKRHKSNLDLIIEKKKLIETNKKYKTHELKQKKNILKDIIENNIMPPGSNKLTKKSLDVQDKTQLIKNEQNVMENKSKEVPTLDKEGDGKGKSKKRGTSAKGKRSKSKKNKKGRKGNGNKSSKGDSIEDTDTVQKTFNGFSMQNNDIHKFYKAEYDISLKRNENEQIGQNNISTKIAWNSTSISNFKETELTSPKQSLLNTISNN